MSAPVSASTAVVHRLQRDPVAHHGAASSPVAGLKRANEALPAPLTAPERDAMVQAAAAKISELFDVLRIDHAGDPATRDTPRRVAKMLVCESMRGRYEAPPALTDFENVGGYAGLIVTGPIEVRSTCAHHLMPIYGSAFIGVLPAPGGRVVGLSKYDRVVDHFASRPQTQEDLVGQVGRYLFDATAPRGLAVRVSAVHMCKTHRGVRAGHGSRMVTTAWYGDLADDRSARDEFLRECLALERGSPP